MVDGGFLLSGQGEVLGLKYGAAFRYIWAIGLLAAGQSSTMTGTLAGQYVMQGFINFNVSPWVRVLITRSIAIVPAVLVAAFSTAHLDDLDEWLNVVQSIQLPFAVLPLILFCADRAVMGEFATGKVLTGFVWAVFLTVLCVNVFLCQDFARNRFDFQGGTVLLYLMIPIGIVYLGFLAYIAYRQLVLVPRGLAAALNDPPSLPVDERELQALAVGEPAPPAPAPDAAKAQADGPADVRANVDVKYLS